MVISKSPLTYAFCGCLLVKTSASCFVLDAFGLQSQTCGANAAAP